MKTNRCFFFWRLSAGFCLGVFLLCVSVAGADIPSATGKSILVYYENDGGASSAALRSRFAYFNQISTDTCAVNDRGIVTGKNPREDLAFAQSRKMQTFAAISNFAEGGFSAPMVHSILTSPAAAQNFINGLGPKLARGHYTGINIDFEAIPPGDRDRFTAFIKTVAGAMHTAGYQVVVSVPAKENDDPSDSWTGAFDFRALGSLIDVLQLMTYDENGTWSQPGPVAGLPWVESAVRYAVSVVPPQKISLGIPAYGYDWDLDHKTENQQVPWTGIPALLSLAGGKSDWDAAASSPHLRYDRNGHRHVVWYENAQSLGLKVRLVAAYRLGGISVYALGMEDDGFWRAIHAGGF